MKVLRHQLQNIFQLFIKSGKLFELLTQKLSWLQFSIKNNHPSNFRLFFAQVGFLIAAKTGTSLHSAHPVSLSLSLVSSCPVALSKHESLALYYLYGRVQAVSYDSYLGSTQTNNQGCSSVLTKLSS